MLTYGTVFEYLCVFSASFFYFLLKSQSHIITLLLYSNFNKNNKCVYVVLFMTYTTNCKKCSNCR